MIPLELFLTFLLITGLLFAGHLFYIGAEYWIDIILGILSAVFMVILTVLFAAGQVGILDAGTWTGLNNSALVFLFGILCVLTVLSALFRAATALLSTYERGGY